MKLAVRRSGLLEALEKVSKVSPTSKSVPILTHARLDADSSGLRIFATDMMSSLTVSCADVVVKETGSCLVPVHDFLQAMKSATGDGVVLVLQEEGLLSRSGSTTWLWKFPPLENFPEPVDLETVVSHSIPRVAFLQALKKVKTACPSKDSFNPRLEQVGIRSGRVIAADGIRYHSIEVPNTDLLDLALPLSFVGELSNLLSETEEEFVLGVTADKKSVVVRYQDSILSTLLLADEFPDVTQAFLVPAMSNQHTLKLTRDSLLGAIRRVRILSDSETSSVKISLFSGKISLIEVSSQSRSGSWSKESLSAEWSEASDRVLTFHHAHLSHLLQVFDEGSLTFKLGSDIKNRPSPLLISQDGRSAVLHQLKADW